MRSVIIKAPILCSIIALIFIIISDGTQKVSLITPASAKELGKNVMCSSESSLKAAKLMREIYPESMEFEERKAKINHYLQVHVWELFDADNSGTLNFEEFLSSEWASFLALVPEGRCQIFKAEFMHRFLGEQSNPRSAWHTPGVVGIYQRLYATIDPEDRGWFEMNDLRAMAREEFNSMDRDRDGLLSKQEFPSPKS